jgi:hypothetical protein
VEQLQSDTAAAAAAAEVRSERARAGRAEAQLVAATAASTVTVRAANHTARVDHAARSWRSGSEGTPCSVRESGIGL